MDYTDFRYLWPPRPETKIAKPQLAFYQKRGFVAQKKKNGTCTVVFAKGDQVIFKTRHNDDHKAWEPQADHLQFFSGLHRGWNVFVGELLHSKVSGGPRNELYLFDQLVEDGKQLTGVTFAERQEKLAARFSGEEEDDQTRVAPRIVLAANFTSGFSKLFDTLKPEDEGLVLKNPKSVLKDCLRPDSNVGWQVKCRIAQANYSFSFALYTILAGAILGMQCLDSCTFGLT